MQKTITPTEMKRVEKRVMAETALTGEMLMHQAASHVAQAVLRFSTENVLCVCGTGNNGGDGLAAMRQLLSLDRRFFGQVWLLPGDLSADAQRELQLLEAAVQSDGRVFIRVLKSTDELAVPSQTGCIIDALFGTGLSRPLEGLTAAVCRCINQANTPVVAVDIPSGLSGVTGQALGQAVHATETVTFHRAKPGLYLGNGPDYAGKITVCDIGLWASSIRALDNATGLSLLEKSDLQALLPPRRRCSHKGSYGRVLIWAGSRGMAGAAAISATAALRTGAGLVTVACPESIWSIVQTLCPCATCLPLPSHAEEAFLLLEPALMRCDAFAAGCGLGQDAETARLLALVVNRLSTCDLPAVLDADALNLLAVMEPLPKLPHALITPHPAEAARLLGGAVSGILEDAPQSAVRLREKYGVSVVLKGACSVLCAKEGLGLNPYGTPAMAKGGSGDALTGVLAALLAGRAAKAYEMNDLQLLQTGCALHGLAGEAAERQLGQRGVLATDLCRFLGENVPQEILAVSPSASTPLGNMVSVVVEHKRGQKNPHSQTAYERNCGYVQEVLQQNNQWQNACLIGVNEPVDWFEGQVIATAIVEDESLWLVAPPGPRVSEPEAASLIGFLGTARHIQTL